MVHIIDHECILRIPNFSDEKMHTPGSSAPVEDDEIMEIDVYANGMNADEQGYVTISFLCYEGLNDQTSCVVSVVDASGNRRFPTSCVFVLEENTFVAYDSCHTVIMGRVMKRDTLLSEADELLPEDCLTLHFHIVDNKSYFEYGVEEPIGTFKYPSTAEGDVRLPLNSALAKRLIEVSSYFRGMSEAPMVEKQRGYANFSDEEYHNMLVVCDILLGRRDVLILSLDHLREIYVIADKYDVPPVVESCRCMLSVLLRNAEDNDIIMEHVMNKIQQFLGLAEARYDIRLKDIVESFLQKHREGSRTVESTAGHQETEWRLEKVYKSALTAFNFVRNEQRREDRFGFYQ